MYFFKEVSKKQKKMVKIRLKEKNIYKTKRHY